MVLPYLKGLVIIKCGFFYIALWIYCVFSICGDYISDLVLVLNKWYQSTFLGRSCGQLFFIFADFFFGEEKRGPRHSRHFQYISVKNLQKRVVYLSSSQKKTQFEKKKSSKRSPEGQDIEVLKSAIFQGFFCGRRRDLFLFL
jgi:hypothetical protein